MKSAESASKLPPKIDQWKYTKRKMIIKAKPENIWHEPACVRSMNPIIQQQLESSTQQSGKWLVALILTRTRIEWPTEMKFQELQVVYLSNNRNKYIIQDK